MGGYPYPPRICHCERSGRTQTSAQSPPCIKRTNSLSAFVFRGGSGHGAWIVHVLPEVTRCVGARHSDDVLWIRACVHQQERSPPGATTGNASPSGEQATIEEGNTFLARLRMWDILLLMEDGPWRASFLRNAPPLQLPRPRATLARLTGPSGSGSTAPPLPYPGPLRRGKPRSSRSPAPRARCRRPRSACRRSGKRRPSKR
jgi:hypothetical protein